MGSLSIMMVSYPVVGLASRWSNTTRCPVLGSVLANSSLLRVVGLLLAAVRLLYV